MDYEEEYGRAKEAQRRLIRKEMQLRAYKRYRAEEANEVGSFSKKFVDKAEDISGKIAEFVKEHLGAIAVLAVILMLLAVIAGAGSVFSIFMFALEDMTVATSYTAEDADILQVDENYSELEEDLQNEISNIERDYPGYDEYRYSLDEIGHNPYQLAAILTVLYENYTPNQVQQKIEDIFDHQYTLTKQRIVETRYRDEERTGYRTVYPENGEPYIESYTYTETVAYQYYILRVTLTNHTLENVVANMALTDDQRERYSLLVETYGNKRELFEDDIYSIVEPGEYQDYDVPAEYLTDQQFANMLHEAEQYLGYPYVWGGSSPSTSFDCSGFVSWVINNCSNGWSVGRQTANGLRGCTLSVSSPQAGDLIFFQGTYETNGASHVGIVVDPVNKIMIHCGNPIQYASYDTSYWRSHFLSYGRL